MSMASTLKAIPAYVAVFTNIPKLLDNLKNVMPNLQFVDVSPGLEDADLKKLRDAEIVIGDYNILEPHLYQLKAKWVQGTWAGVETLMKAIDPNKPKLPYTITRFSGKNFGYAMSEYVLASIVSHERNLWRMHDDQGSRTWNQDGMFDYRLVGELNVGILGLGSIGSHMAKVLKSLEATVWGLVRTVPQEMSPHVDHYLTLPLLPELLRGCDYIINVLPSTPATVGLLDGGVLQNCASRKTVFINVGRGSVVAEVELVRALEQGWLEAAILDVFEAEPLAGDSPLWSMPQVRITPHISGTTRSRNVAERFQENFQRYLTNQPLLQPVNLDKGY